ncbi:MAG: chemotaxis protein CheX [Phycisphaerales bacterium]
MSSSLDPRYVTAFVQATKKVFQTMLGLEVTFGDPIPGKLPHLVNDISVIIPMTGGVIGTVVLSLPVASAEKIASSFVGSPVDRKSDDFADALGELVNMISGAAKANFAEKQVCLSRPSVVMGEENTVQPPSDSVCVSIPCRSSYGDFAVEVSLKKVAVSQTNRPAIA